MALVDTHCHLDFNLFDSDRENVIDRAHRNGISYIINPGLNLETSRAILHLCDVFPGLYAGVGVHPSEVGGWNQQTDSEIRALAGQPKVVAIGEIGLDYYHEPFDANLQKEVLICQLDIAAAVGLPVIIHSRESLDDILSILSAWHSGLKNDRSPLAGRPGVLHAFEGDNVMAQKFIAMNFYIGIGGPVTYRNAEKKRSMVADLPIDRMLLETDAPFLAPHPFRGQRNEPGYVTYVAERVSTLKGQSIESISSTTTWNASLLFKQEFID